MTASVSSQEQIASLIADIMPQQILSFKFSEEVNKRILSLTTKKKKGIITLSESEELEKHLTYDLLIGLAKARAFQALKND